MPIKLNNELTALSTYFFKFEVLKLIEVFCTTLINKTIILTERGKYYRHFPSTPPSPVTPPSL